MKVIFKFVFFIIITRTHCQRSRSEENIQNIDKKDEQVEIPDNYQVNIERRFLEDLDDFEWHVAHLRGAEFDGRRDCRGDTFIDKAKRYRRMLKNDGARVEFVSSEPIENDPADITRDSCRLDIESWSDEMTSNVSTTASNATSTGNATTDSTTATTPANATTLTVPIPPTSAAPNLTSVFKTTASMTMGPTTPKIDLQATTFDPKFPKDGNETLEKMRRASEYMFSSIEYYEDSVEFDETACPDAVEVITLDIDQLRSYDLECEMTLEWRSLE
ncbi:unnamed protein product [Chrysodeixis includens]|uniref:Uncharacterized protein n=1 Tax=Chrysodeixis includens TaxID=689277 RepID=A0A9N8KSP2_CHRIL|nr:unnamed protein product [Chrysodeixis includens]